MISDQERQDLITLNRLNELLLPERVDRAVPVAAITRTAQRRRCQPRILQEEVMQQIRSGRIKQAQDEETGYLV